jgi:hypothetical protein
MPGRTINGTSYLSPYHSHGRDWGMVSQHVGSSSSIEIGPGYYCGVGLERVGMKVLYMAKLTIYRKIARRSYGDEDFHRFLRKHVTLSRLGIIIQESIDLTR